MSATAYIPDVQRVSAGGEDEFEQLFSEVWASYPESQTPVQTHAPFALPTVDNRPRQGSSPHPITPQSMTPPSRSSRGSRPLPPTPGSTTTTPLTAGAGSRRASVTSILRPSTAIAPALDGVNEDAATEHFTPNPVASPQAQEQPATEQPAVPYSPPEFTGRLINEETSSIYPGWDTPALPLYEPPPPVPAIPPPYRPDPSDPDRQSVYIHSAQSSASYSTTYEPSSVYEPSLHSQQSSLSLSTSHHETQTPTTPIRESEPVSTPSTPYSDYSIVNGNNEHRSTYAPAANSVIDADQQSVLSYASTGQARLSASRETLNHTRRTSSPALTQIRPSSHRNSITSLMYAKSERSFDNEPGPSNLFRRPTQMLQQLGDRQTLVVHEHEVDYWPMLEEEDSEERFINFAFLSNIAVQLRDKVARGTHVKGGVPYPNAFTGKDIVSAIQTLILKELIEIHGGSSGDRRAAVQIARSLQSQLFFYEVEWGNNPIQDGVEDVYMFMDDQQNGHQEALPTSVVTIMAKCYSPSCGEGPECYAYGCPSKGDSLRNLLPEVMEESTSRIEKLWPPDLIRTLPESEIQRQTIIHKLIAKEEQYVKDLDMIDTVFIKPLRAAYPPVISPVDRLNAFIDQVFHNISSIRDCNRRLLEVLYVRQREQAPVIQSIGDILLDAATNFRDPYPAYVGNHPLAERRMRDELENNPEFRLFIERCSRRQQSARQGAAPRLDLRHFLTRPSEHLQKYPVLMQAILNETKSTNPDAEFLSEAIKVFKDLQGVAQLRTFQSAMGRGLTGKWEWDDLINPQERKWYTTEEITRQCAIFDLIKGEMIYVKKLENIEHIFIRALRKTEPPIIPRDRLERFIQEVFFNFTELYSYHRRLVDALHEIQREKHPRISSITAPVYDAALNFRDAYLEYIPNYPIAAYRIDEEMEKNPAFKAFVENCTRHPDAHRMSMKDFLNCPLARLLEYEELLKQILDATPRGHEDRITIPEVIDVIKALGREAEPGVTSAKQKVQLWQYNSSLTFKPGETMDLDLLNENRSLMHTGRLIRPPETASDPSGWTELFVLLFDNYLVPTQMVEENGVKKYLVTRRPFPLDLLTLLNFNNLPTQCTWGVTRHISSGSSGSGSSRSGQSENGDSQPAYPFTIHHNGRNGGPYTLYTDSIQRRFEWKQKLEEAVGLRKVVQESNKVFEMETLSMQTFTTPPTGVILNSSTWNENISITGKATCSIPFSTPDGRRLVAIGCAEGVWIGFRHDSSSMRRVLHLKNVTQCTMLDDFGLFLVLTDKQLFAYQIEALVPTPQMYSNATSTPQKLNGNKEVCFFSVGKMDDRTYVVFMRKKGADSYFHVLEPILERIHERPRAPTGLFNFRAPKTDWFDTVKEFYLSCDAYDLVFLKAKIAILSAKGFHIMGLEENKGTVIPQADPRLRPFEKKYENRRPIGMFRSKEDEFLLCYTTFGVFVDKHGTPSRRTCTVEWEGTADSAAFHAPYVLLFDPRFIEIRHVDTGRLAQIIQGVDMRCVWDGRGLNSNPAITAGVQDDGEMVQEAHVHAVMNMVDHNQQAPGRPLRPVTQHVFELIPTIPLYLPGSLSSPSNIAYIPISTPPRSPQLRPMHSFS